MEREDKLIRELLKEGLLKTAPDGFTDSVMDKVSAVEQPKEMPLYVYLSMIFGAVAIGLGIIYFTSPGFLGWYASYFVDFMSGLLLPFKGLFSEVSIPDYNLRGSSTFFGILVVIALLLGFDALITRRWRVMNMFV
jgi:VIT1/CCC1 family predicted Fe2+/Mn2+ transporter